MNPIKLKTILDKKFNVLCFLDLAEVNQLHSTAYKIFDQYHRDAFDPTDRIVFYSGYLPSDKFLEHIQRAANLIDISSCFIMICGPVDITDKLKTLSHDENSIEYFKINVESNPLLPDQLLEENTLCPIPWANLAIMPLGRAKPCCASKNFIGDATTESLTDMFYSQHMDQIRHDMKLGKQPEDCKHCWDLEKNHIKSNRKWHLDMYSKQFYTKWIDNPEIRMIDFRPSNICNFKCRICDPVSSSLFSSELKKNKTNKDVVDKLKIINQRGRWFDNDDHFINQVIELLPSLVNIDFYGGEPFLLKQLPRVLKIAIDSNHAKNIRLHFNTNGSIFPAQLIPYLEQFKEVQLSVSVDNIGKRFELERGGAWTDIETNIKKFKEQSQINLDLSIMPTVNIQNVFYLDELINWAHDMNIKIVFNYLDNPECMSIDYMTPAAKQLVVDKFLTHPRVELQKIAYRIQKSTGSDGSDFVEYMKNFDSWRNEDFVESHKEIAIAMGYQV
jgi:MoaA/NifB/PqqE/SkfB family radical SAM enzyme